MKQLFVCSLLLVCLSFSKTSFSQVSSKPNLFNNYPSLIACNENTLQNIFNATEGQNISVAFSNNFSFVGNVSANIVKYSNLQTVTITASQLDNALLCISKIINEDNSITYTGRILNTNYADGYVIAKNRIGNYELTKTETVKQLQVCKQ
jgi:hypothetical protein